LNRWSSKTGVPPNFGGPGLFFSLLLIAGAVAVYAHTHFSHETTALPDEVIKVSPHEAGGLTSKIENHQVRDGGDVTKSNSKSGDGESVSENQRAREDFKKIELLKEILQSKNDNDPRLDTDLKVLSEGTKSLMREQYKQMRAESFNEKGTVVFLLGRNLNSVDDFTFLSQVLSEPPCQSMEDCTRSSPPTQGEAVHEESVNSVTMSYPQIVSLRAIEHFLIKNRTIDNPLKSAALKNLELAKNSPDALVSREAQVFSSKYLP